jgi:hypothetical protein
MWAASCSARCLAGLRLRVFTDGSCQGPVVAGAAVKALPIMAVEIVKRSSDTTRRFEDLPKRWVVERPLGWHGRSSRLAKGFENLNGTALTFLWLASIRLMVRRICKADKLLGRTLTCSTCFRRSLSRTDPSVSQPPLVKLAPKQRPEIWRHLPAATQRSGNRTCSNGVRLWSSLEPAVQ